MLGTEQLSIGQVARQLGMRASAIRYYEQVGLLAAPARASGQRRYTPGDVARLEVIRAARQSGFALGEIRQLLTAHPRGTPPAARWQRLAATKLPEVERLIAQATLLRSLLVAGSQCACLDLEQCFGVREAGGTAP